MNQSSYIVAFIVAAFLIFITARGDLSKYFAVFL